MFTFNRCLLLSAFALVTNAAALSPPVAPKQPWIHQDLVCPSLNSPADDCETRERHDDYQWLRHREAVQSVGGRPKEAFRPGIAEHIADENAYADWALKGAGALAKKLRAEMEARFPKSTVSAPVVRGEYEYFSVLPAGQELLVYKRRHRKSGVEETLLDLNAIAQATGKLAYSPGPSISPDGRFIAYALDLERSRSFGLYVKDLQTGNVEQVRARGLTAWNTGFYFWNTQSTQVYYTLNDDTDRPYQMRRHNVSFVPTDPAQPTGLSDEIVYEELDTTFFLYSRVSIDGRFGILYSKGWDLAENRVVDLSEPSAKPRLIAAKRDRHLYDVDHSGSHFLIRTNLDSMNFRVVRAPDHAPGIENWVDLHPRDPSSTVESFVPFRDRVVLFESRKTFRQARVIEADGTIRALKLSGKQLANLAPVDNVDYHSSRLRYRQETYLEPESVREYDFATGKIDVLTTTPVDPSYDPSLYVETRVFAKAADGKEIPITLVRRKEVTLGMSTPLYVDSYGNYGMVFPADFSVGLASLLDRGVVYAWIHTRGSSDMGYAAYVDGKLMNKLNTFTDFVTGLKHLHQLGLSSPNRTAVSSLSAGGLLIGYLVNNYPTLAKAYIANVPFVDLISTMKDETIPLTAQEWLEWGNPRVRAEYEYMLGYSPYDQVPYGDAPKRQYPALFVTTALNDYAVFYWEPLKWVAKMRNNAINPESIVLRVWEDSGHGDGFSPLAQLNRPATNYAFALWQLGIRD